MRRLRFIVVIFGAVFTLSPFASAQQVPDLLPVPTTLSQDQHEQLTKRKSQLETQWYNLVLKVNDHNRKCNKVPANTPLANECRENMKSLQGAIAGHIEEVNSFNQAVRRQTTIARIEVPPPLRILSLFDACAGVIVCMFGSKVGEAMDWLQEKFWDARVWANDPMHGDWLDDAAAIVSPFVQDVVGLASARAMLGVGRPAAATTILESEAARAVGKVAGQRTAAEIKDALVTEWLVRLYPEYYRVPVLTAPGRSMRVVGLNAPPPLPPNSFAYYHRTTPIGYQWIGPDGDSSASVIRALTPQQRLEWLDWRLRGAPETDPVAHQFWIDTRGSYR